MKRGQTYEGLVRRVDFPNKAIVDVQVPDLEGNITLEKAVVKGALPGQRIRLRVTKARRDKAQGRLLEVIEPGTIETVSPKCPHFGTCGGCHYQSLSYQAQLDLKREQVQRLIDNVYEKPYTYDGIVSSPSEWEYRNKMEFSFGDEVKDGPLCLGMHKKGSFHDIIDVEGCKIIHEDYSKILCCVREYAAGNHLDFYHKNTHTGFLRHLLVRRSQTSGELLVALVTSSQQDVDLTQLKDELLELGTEGKIVGILHIINDTMGDVVQSDETRIIYGRDWFTESILGLEFRISLFSFFQTNTKGAEKLYQRVREYVLDQAGAETFADKVIFDLYSGTGTIAQMLAPIAKKVIGVEIVEDAVIAARENAKINNLSNCEFIAGDVLKILDEIEDKPDYIILDPPRDGIHPKAIRKIIDYGVENIVYISCKPTSFARDLQIFEESGYQLERVSNIDLFPQTPHVETVVLMSKVK